MTPSPFVQWLDATLGPPWSGLVVLGMVGALSLLSAYLGVRTVNHVFADGPPQLSQDLARCALCRAFTRSVPIVVVRHWRLHASVCLECSVADVDPPNLGIFLLHRAPVGQLVQAVRVGNVVWDLPRTR